MIPNIDIRSVMEHKTLREKLLASSQCKGVACKGGPSEVTVCGSCGVLYDSVVPEFEDSF